MCFLNLCIMSAHNKTKCNEIFRVLKKELPIKLFCFQVVTDVDGIPPARDTPVLSSHPASPNPHHGGAAEIKKNHLSVRILELQLAGTGDLDYPRIHLLHPALMSRKMKRNFCKWKPSEKLTTHLLIFFKSTYNIFFKKEVIHY